MNTREARSCFREFIKKYDNNRIRITNDKPKIFSEVDEYMDRTFDHGSKYGCEYVDINYIVDLCVPDLYGDYGNRYTFKDVKKNIIGKSIIVEYEDEPDTWLPLISIKICDELCLKRKN
jgi:hypothetical protein